MPRCLQSRLSLQEQGPFLPQRQGLSVALSVWGRGASTGLVTWAPFCDWLPGEAGEHGGVL